MRKDLSLRFCAEHYNFNMDYRMLSEGAYRCMTHGRGEEYLGRVSSYYERVRSADQADAKRQRMAALSSTRAKVRKPTVSRLFTFPHTQSNASFKYFFEQKLPKISC